MALTIDSTKPIDRAFYEDKLFEIGCVYIDAGKYKNKAKQVSAESRYYEENLLAQVQLLSKGKYNYLQPRSEEIQGTLVGLGVPEGKFCCFDTNTKQYRESRDRAKVIEPLLNELENGTLKIGGNENQAISLLKGYCAYKDLVSAASGTDKKMARAVDTEYVNKFGTPLKAIHYKYTQRVTGRYYTSDDNVQAWNKKYISSICAPKGKVLVWADFAQVDLRVAINLFLRTKDNANIFDTVEDKYEALVRAMYQGLGRPFDYADFKAARPRYKVLALAKLYNQSNLSATGATGDAEIVNLLDEFYNTCTKYRAYKADAQYNITNQIDGIVSDYFGHTRQIGFDDYNPLSLYLNDPIQATSASIMPVTTNAIIQKFYSLGYREDQIQILLNRHDEIIFMIDKEVMKDSWVFKDYSTIYIDDWSPLQLEMDFGDFYKEPNKEYKQMFEDSWKSHLGENLERQTPRDYNISRKGETFYPIEQRITLVTTQGMTLDQEEIRKTIQSCVGSQMSPLEQSGELADLIRGYLGAQDHIYIINHSKGIVCRLQKGFTLDSVISQLKVLNLSVIDQCDVDQFITTNKAEVRSVRKNMFTIMQIINQLDRNISKEGKYFRMNPDVLNSWVV